MREEEGSASTAKEIHPITYSTFNPSHKIQPIIYFPSFTLHKIYPITYSTCTITQNLSHHLFDFNPFHFQFSFSSVQFQFQSHSISIQFQSLIQLSSLHTKSIHHLFPFNPFTQNLSHYLFNLQSLRTKFIPSLIQPQSLHPQLPSIIYTHSSLEKHIITF